MLVSVHLPSYIDFCPLTYGWTHYPGNHHLSTSRTSQDPSEQSANRPLPAPLLPVIVPHKHPTIHLTTSPLHLTCQDRISQHHFHVFHMTTSQLLTNSDPLQALT